ncbi:Olfactomedin-like domain-containing protein [Strongyloides ratti]|uniref:Olfactomedin-like domain-containing protein n=1 Tax=Strongyloides ratti TaxID=34506 RepID=A0A090MX70_STRRB|nr:Olfactomedin-like domain-containing protein [Strongyloides ratti]CEF64919.1 Olfactomedin-like domain-containing protein [Strongyloides ratti]
MKQEIEGKEYSKTKRSIVTLSLITLNILLIIFLTITIWYQRHELVKLNENIKIINNNPSSLNLNEVLGVDDDNDNNRKKKRKRRQVMINEDNEVEYPSEGNNNNKQQSSSKTFFAPLYAAVTEDIIDEICSSRNRLIPKSNDQKKTDNVIVMTLDKGKQGPQYSQDQSLNIITNEEKNKYKSLTTKKELEAFKKSKTCSRIIGLGLKTMHSERRITQSGIVKKGNSWFITELSIGYTVFEITHNNGIIDFNDPKEIYTLPSPFVGSNHAFDEVKKNYYYITDDGSYIMKFNLITLKGNKSKKYPVIINNINNNWDINIYSQINGTSALHLDSGYLWMVYNKDKNNHLTISRINKDTLEEIRRIRLNKFDRKIAGSFISCGIFYVIECEGIQCRILSVYDLIHGKYVLRKDKFNVLGHWNSFGLIKSISFDNEKKTLAILDKDKIYTIHLKII